MSNNEISKPPLLPRVIAEARRFYRWLSKPQVILSLIMLVLIFYMVIIPLYRMVMTTITVSDSDLRVLKDAEIGEFTNYHWLRMLTSKIAKIMTFEPLVHSLTISLGATLLALTIGGLMAWMVVRTDMPGKGIVHLLATVPYIMPSWTIAMAWTVLFKNRTSGGTPGLLEFLLGHGPPDWLAYRTSPDYYQQWPPLLHFLFPVCICSAAFYRTLHWKKPENSPEQVAHVLCVRLHFLW